MFFMLVCGKTRRLCESEDTRAYLSRSFGSTSYYFGPEPALVGPHTFPALCLLFLFPLGELKAQHEGMVGAQASPSITPHPHHSGYSRAGRQSSLLTCLHPSISELAAGYWDLFQGHHPSYIWVLSPAPFLSNP